MQWKKQNIRSVSEREREHGTRIQSVMRCDGVGGQIQMESVM